MGKDYFTNLHWTSNTKLFEYAKRMRKEMTPSEKVLWEELRAKKLGVNSEGNILMIVSFWTSIVIN